MSNIHVNAITGQVAIAPEGTGPQQSNIHVYEPGMYKINLQTGQVAIPSANGQYEIHDLTPSQMHALSSPEAVLARQTGSAVGLSQGESAPSLTESTARGASQGVSLGTQDEVNAAIQAVMAKMRGDQAPVDPNHPVTGGMSSDFSALYNNSVGQERQANTAAKAENPKAFKAAMYGGALLPALAMPANTIRQAATSGAAQGGLLGLGLADTEDMKKLLMSGAFGAGGGALLGGLTRGIQSAAFDNNTGTGIAYNALAGSAPGHDIGNIQVRPGSMPAELDPAMSDLLRTAGAKNGPVAAEAIPQARGRVDAVNQAIYGEVGNRLSPEDAQLLLQRIQEQGQTTNQAAYAAAHANPTRIGLTPDVTRRPSFQEALASANARATDEMPPRQIDPTNLSSLDMDLIDRALQRAQTAATQSHGDTSQAAQIAQARIPTRGEVAGTVRQVADQAFPELATARQGAAQSFSLERAIEAGHGWLKSTTSPEQVGAEFNAMPPEQQQAALASFATDLRNTLGTKTARANLGQVFEKIGLADKMLNLGVPQESVDAMVQGGQGARQVLAALEGGSMTARNQAGAEAMQSSLSQIKGGDLVAAGVLHSPAVAAALPLVRGAGGRAEREAARQIIVALTTPGGRGLTSLINRAPQTWGGMLNAPARTAGSLLGSSFGGM